MQAVVSPEKIRFASLKKPSVFLAGSIDQGVTEDWQSRMTTLFDDHDVIFFNPRRTDWDKNADDNAVREQIYWELDALAMVDAIIVYFAPDSLAPISLLELGLHAKDKRVVVVCPPGYWRRTNVQVVCARHDIDVYDDLEDGMKAAIALANFNFLHCDRLKRMINA